MVSGLRKRKDSMKTRTRGGRTPTRAHLADMVANAQELMENDPVFESNLRSLTQRIDSGKVPGAQFRHLRSAIAAEALRRNRLPLSAARLVLRYV